MSSVDTSFAPRGEKKTRERVSDAEERREKREISLEKMRREPTIQPTNLRGAEDTGHSQF
jgi:hypothetical protein